MTTVLASPDLVTLAQEHSGDVRAFLSADEGSELLEKVVEAVAAGDTITVSSLVGDLTPAQAAKMLGVTRPMVMKWIADGQLESTRAGSRHRLKVDDVLRLRAEREATGKTR